MRGRLRERSGQRRLSGQVDVEGGQLAARDDRPRLDGGQAQRLVEHDALARRHEEQRALAGLEAALLALDESPRLRDRHRLERGSRSDASRSAAAIVVPASTVRCTRARSIVACVSRASAPSARPRSRRISSGSFHDAPSFRLLVAGCNSAGGSCTAPLLPASVESSSAGSGSRCAEASLALRRGLRLTRGRATDVGMRRHGHRLRRHVARPGDEPRDHRHRVRGAGPPPRRRRPAVQRRLLPVRGGQERLLGFDARRVCRCTSAAPPSCIDRRGLAARHATPRDARRRRASVALAPTSARRRPRGTHVLARPSSSAGSRAARSASTRRGQPGDGARCALVGDDALAERHGEAGDSSPASACVVLADVLPARARRRAPGRRRRASAR